MASIAFALVVAMAMTMMPTDVKWRKGIDEQEQQNDGASNTEPSRMTLVATCLGVLQSRREPFRGTQ